MNISFKRILKLLLGYLLIGLIISLIVSVRDFKTGNQMFNSEYPRNFMAGMIFWPMILLLMIGWIFGIGSS